VPGFERPLVRWSNRIGTRWTRRPQEATRLCRCVAHPNATVRPSRGPRNSLWYVYRDVGFLRVTWNVVWIVLARYSPSQRLKRLLYRMVGARVGRYVSFGFESTLDILYPHLITIEDDAVIGYDTTLLCHGYLRNQSMIGPVTIGQGAAIGAKCLILPGVTIGAGAVVGAMSLVNKDIPPGEFWGGVPAKRIRARYAES
jgi:acetyltransferase-like isoleucine patch superfamily enzyme